MWSLAWLQALLFMTAHGALDSRCVPVWAHDPYWETDRPGAAALTNEQWYNTRSVICYSPKVDLICTWTGCAPR